MDKVSIAAAFHDLGIWADDTFDYLAPSERLARAYLARTNRLAWVDEVEAIIEEHHKLGRYLSHPEWLVEPFRRADWTDVSRGVLRFGLPRRFVGDVVAAFPNAGFHRKLVALTWRQFKAHPLSPIPVLRL